MKIDRRFLLYGFSFLFYIAVSHLSYAKDNPPKIIKSIQPSKDSLARAEEFYSAGLTHLLAGRCEDALQSFKKTIKKNPRHPDAYFNIAYCYSNLGRHNEAVEAYKQAIRIKPDYTNAHYNLGIGYLIFKNRGGALEEYKILKELDKDSADKLFNLIYK